MPRHAWQPARTFSLASRISISIQVRQCHCALPVVHALATCQLHCQQSPFLCFGSAGGCRSRGTPWLGRRFISRMLAQTTAAGDCAALMCNCADSVRRTVLLAIMSVGHQPVNSRLRGSHTWWAMGSLNYNKFRCLPRTGIINMRPLAYRLIGAAASFSSTAAMPMPVPIHMDTTPYRLPLLRK